MTTLTETPAAADLYEELRALHWARTKFPDTPAVSAARKAKAELWARIATDDYRTRTRDERRLDTRYAGLIEAHETAMLEAYRRR